MRENKNHITNNHITTMSNNHSTNAVHNNSSLSDLIELIKTTRQGFIIQEDLDAISLINSNIKQVKEQTFTSLQSKTKEINILRGKVNKSNEKNNSLSVELDLSRNEAKKYADENKIFKEYTHKLNDAKNKQEELKKNIDMITEELATLQTSQTVDQNNSKSQLTKDDERTYHHGDLQKDKEITSFDDITVDEEDSFDSDYSDDEKDPDYYKLEVFKAMDIVVDPETNEVFISRKDGKVDILSLEESRNDFFNNKFVWERLNME